MTARLRPLTRILSSVLAAAIVMVALQPGHGGHGGWSLAHAPAAFAQVSGWVGTLTGAPAAPRPLSAAEWDVVVHSRDDGTWRAFDPMQAEHGADCGPPTSTHLVTRYEDAVYQCRDHVMTAINASGYGLVYLTPNQLVDFSKGEAVVRFDLSTFRASGRDWVDLWVTPFEDHHILPLDDWMPDLQGPPRRGIHIRMDNQQGKTMFRVERIDGHTVTDLDSCWWCVYEDVLAPAQSRRDTFELRISRTHVKFWMPNHGITWADASVADLGWDAGVVQFGHHS